MSFNDDYAWLKDPHDPERNAYLAAERAHYEQATAHLAGLRGTLEREFTSRTADADVSASWPRGGYLYRTQVGAGEEYERLYRIDLTTGVESLVLDPNAIAPLSDYLGLGVVEPSPDGRLVAYGVDTTGEERFELRFRDLETGYDLPDRVPGTSYGGAWSADSKTFVYTVTDQTGRPERAVAHRLGTEVDLDWVVHIEPDRRFELSVSCGRDGRWIVLQARSRDTSEVLLVPAGGLDEPLAVVAARRPGIDYQVEVLPGGWDGRGPDTLLLVTNDGAPEFRLVHAAIPDPGTTGDPAGWVAVPGATLPGERLHCAAVVGGHVVLGVRGGCEPYLRVLDRVPNERGRRAAREIHAALPAGRLELWKAEDGLVSSVIVVEQNLVTAPAWVQVDLATGARTVLKRTPQPGVDPTRYVTERIEARSVDGTRVPVTIARLRELEPGRSGGALLTGYGAYEHPLWPRYGVGTLSLLDRGVVVALAHVRGGGELGRAWWQAGRRRNKQRSVDDLLAARDALVEAGWAGQASVVGRGASAGGLLLGAAFSQAPQRWRAVVAEVPFVDVVTTMSDPDLPLTVTEWDEWGNPLESAEDLAALRSLSPYDNPPEGWRPPLLVTAAVNDPRVLVHEPAKWVARLRATDASRPPSGVLLRVELGGAGHGGLGGRFAALRHEVEILSWVLHQLGRDQV